MAAGSGGRAAPHLISGLYRRPILIDESPQCGPGTIVGAGGASRGMVRGLAQPFAARLLGKRGGFYIVPLLS
jgi:hypothetical protein